MSDDKDLGLETLLAVRAKLGVNVSDDLLKKCFEIQRRHQYNHDRSSSTQAIDKLIEAQVDTVAKDSEKGGNS